MRKIEESSRYSADRKLRAGESVRARRSNGFWRAISLGANVITLIVFVSGITTLFGLLQWFGLMQPEKPPQPPQISSAIGPNMSSIQRSDRLPISIGSQRNAKAVTPSVTITIHAGSNMSVVRRSDILAGLPTGYICAGRYVGSGRWTKRYLTIAQGTKPDDLLGQILYVRDLGIRMRIREGTPDKQGSYSPIIGYVEEDARLMVEGIKRSTPEIVWLLVRVLDRGSLKSRRWVQIPDRG